jgi:hypothetical protein
MKSRCSLFPQKRTLLSATGMSACANSGHFDGVPTTIVWVKDWGREVRQSHDIHHPMHSGRAVSEAAPGRRRSFDRAYDNPPSLVGKGSPTAPLHRRMGFKPRLLTFPPRRDQRGGSSFEARRLFLDGPRRRDERAYLCGLGIMLFWPRVSGRVPTRSTATPYDRPPMPLHPPPDRRKQCACFVVCATTGTRSLQVYLGHKNIQNTTRYTELAQDRFKGFWRD